MPAQAFKWFDSTLSLGAWLLGGFLLIVAYPATVVILSELSQRLAKRRHPLGSTLRHIRNLTIPLILGYAFIRWVVGISPLTLWSKALLTAVLSSIVFALISAANDIFFSSADSRSWRSQVPKLFLDLSRGAVVTVGFVIIFSAVWGTDVGALITALGVSSLVVGLALQDTLGSLFAGIGILFDRPFSVGDILRVGNEEGKVIGMTWRSTRLLLKGNESVLVIPNSVLGKDSFINLSRPSLYSERIAFDATAGQPPQRVKSLMKELALDIDGVLSQPEPEVRLLQMAANNVRYEMNLYIQSCEDRHRIRDAFLTRLWYAAERFGLTESAVNDAITSPLEQDTYKALTGRVAGFIASTALLGALSNDDKTWVAQHASALRYAAGEIVQREGQTYPALYLIMSGTAQLRWTDDAGVAHPYLDLNDGDVLGIEEVMLSIPNPSTVVAATDLILIHIPRDIARTAMEHSPKLARDLGEAAEMRRRSLNNARTSA